MKGNGHHTKYYYEQKTKWVLLSIILLVTLVFVPVLGELLNTNMIHQQGNVPGFHPQSMQQIIDAKLEETQPDEITNCNWKCPKANCPAAKPID